MSGHRDGDEQGLGGRSSKGLRVIVVLGLVAALSMRAPSRPADGVDSQLPDSTIRAAQSWFEARGVFAVVATAPGPPEAPGRFLPAPLASAPDSS